MYFRQLSTCASSRPISTRTLAKQAAKLDGTQVLLSSPAGCGGQGVRVGNVSIGVPRRQHTRLRTVREELYAWHISVGVTIPNLLVTVAVASSAFPRKFRTESEKVNSTPTSSAVALSSARRDPWKGVRDALAAVKAAALEPAAAETLQNAESVRAALPEEALPSRRKLPQRPTVWKCPRNR